MTSFFKLSYYLRTLGIVKLHADFQERLARLLLELIQKSERRLGTGEIARYDYISCQHLYLFFYVSVPAPYIPEHLCDEM